MILFSHLHPTGLTPWAALALGLASLTASGHAVAGPGHEIPPSAPGWSRFNERYLQVDLMPPGSCRVGRECQAALRLVTKRGAHLEESYPLTFEAAPAPEGVTFTKPLVKKADGQVSDQRVLLPILFTTTKPGWIKIAGTFSFRLSGHDARKLNLDLEVYAD